jgi:hypothetical protein
MPEVLHTYLQGVVIRVKISQQKVIRQYLTVVSSIISKVSTSTCVVQVLGYSHHLIAITMQNNCLGRVIHNNPKVQC